MLDVLATKLGYSGGGEFGSDAFFPYVDHIADEVMLLADGSRLAVLRLAGAPFSLVMNAERNGYKRRLIAFLNAVADENVEIHLHLVKHDAELPEFRHGEATAAYARALLDDYHATIAPDLAVIDWFLSVRVKPRIPPFSSVTDKVRSALVAVGMASSFRPADPELDVQVEDAMRLAFGTLAPFKPYRLGTRYEPASEAGTEPLAYSQIAEFLYLLRTTQFSPQPMADVLGLLGAGVAAVDVTALSGKSLLRIDQARASEPYGVLS